MAAAMVSLGIATGFERRYGVLKRLGSTPLSRGGLLVAKTANVLALEIAAGRRSIVATGVALGWHVPAGIVPAVGLLLLGTVAFAGIGMLMAGTLRAEANLAAANGLFLVLLFLGGMAYPLAKLPDAIEDFAKALPAAALSETRAAVLVGAARSRPASWSCSIAWAVARPARRRPLVPLGGVAGRRNPRNSVANERSQRTNREVARDGGAARIRARSSSAEQAVAHDAVGVDEERVGHRVHVVAGGHGIVGRVLDERGERDPEAMHERAGVAGEVLIVDADDRDRDRRCRAAPARGSACPARRDDTTTRRRSARRPARATTTRSPACRRDRAA